MTDRRRHHDMGGLEAGPVETNQHAHEPWEKRVDALTMALSAPKIGKRAFYVDERRDKIETMGEDKYESLTYYELWMASVAGVLVDKGMLTEEEIEAKMAEIRDRLGLEAESA